MLIVKPEDYLKFERPCPLSGKSHYLVDCFPKMRHTKGQEEQDVNSKIPPLSFIYGYCIKHNCLFVFYGETNPEIAYIPITKIFLKPSSMLNTFNPKQLISNCRHGRSIQNIEYYNKRKYPILKTAVYCGLCNLVYYFNGEKFISLNGSIDPIIVDKKLINDGKQS